MNTCIKHAFDTIARLCEVLDCEPGDLFELEEDFHTVPVLGGDDEDEIVRQRLAEQGRRVDGPTFVAELLKIASTGISGARRRRAARWMAYRYEFLEAAAKDLFKLTRHNQPLLHAIATEHIPAILRDPLAAGEPQKGDLAHVRAYDLTVKGIAYRLICRLEGDIVLFVAVGPHDVAHDRARRR